MKRLARTISALLLAALAAGCASVPEKPAARAEHTPFEGFANRVANDHRRHYDAQSLAGLLPPLAVSGALAGTNADRWIRDSWQEDVRSGFSDDVADVFRGVGDAAQARWSMPAYAVTMFAAGYSGQPQGDTAAATWAERSLRATILGGPQLLAFGHLLGSGRPEEGGSDWNPGENDNGASGHSFYGAVPFLTAARMTENRAWRYGLYALSVLPAWSRINDDRHYASQVVMGWSLAWLATGTVAGDPDHDDKLSVAPVLLPDGGYLLAQWSF